MKKFHRFLLLTVVPLIGGLLCACTDYQDEIDALDYRVTVLENLVKKVNSDLEAMSVIARAMEQGDQVSNVTKNSEGYIITFKKAGAIIVHDGVDGKDGEDGQDGKDAEVPDISIRKGDDGMYYWVINGQWITTPDGQPLRANGKDGKDGRDGIDGQDGQDGKDGTAPQVRINSETGLWEISIDGGTTWMPTGSSAKGKDGKDGEDANAIVKVITHWNENYVEFITKSGSFRVPLATS